MSQHADTGLQPDAPIRREWTRGVRGQGHHGSQGPRAGPRTARDVHRFDRSVGPPPPRLRGRRQLGRRGAGGPRDPHRRHAARRRRLPGRRQRPRHPGRPAPRVPRQVGGRDRAHDAPRRRQVRRRGLQDLRRPARRRRVGRERAVAPARARDPPRRRPVRDDVRRRRRARPGRSSASATPNDTGTTVTFWPDGTIMEEIEFRAQTLLERLREMAFLNKGLEIVFRDERADPADRADLQVRRRHRRLRRRTSTRRRSRCSSAVVVVRATRTTTARSRSRCSGTPATTRASTRSRTTSPPPRAACTKRASRRPSPTWSTATPAHKGLLKEKDENLLGEDIREGLTAIISVKLRNPQFEGQTKTKLGNTEIRSFVEKVTNEKLGRLARGAPDRGQARSCTKATAGRAGRAWPRARRATSRGASRCSSRRRCRASSPTARRATPKRPSCSSSRATAPAAAPRRPATRAFQAILPIRGKILNVERSRIDKMLQQRGDPGADLRGRAPGIGEEFDLDEAPLPQDHHDDRRRRRRLAHPHAAAHVLLPPAARDRAAAATSTSRSRRCTAPRSARTSART